jgi:hypothetical protein
MRFAPSRVRCLLTSSGPIAPLTAGAVFVITSPLMPVSEPEIPERFQNHRLGELIQAFAIASEGVLERSFQAWLHPDVALLKFSGFCQHWRADLHSHEGKNSFTFRAPLPCRSWRWYLGHRSGLEVVIKLRYPTVSGLMATGHVAVQPYGCDTTEGNRLLREFGTRLLRDLLAHLQARPERRVHERHRFDPPIRFYPMLPIMDTDAVIEGLGEDLSAVSMRFWTPALPEASLLVIKLPLASEEEPVPVLARVERIRDVEAGGHEVIVQFVGHAQAIQD